MRPGTPNSSTPNRIVSTNGYSLSYSDSYGANIPRLRYRQQLLSVLELHELEYPPRLLIRINNSDGRAAGAGNHKDAGVQIAQRCLQGPAVVCR